MAKQPGPKPTTTEIQPRRQTVAEVSSETLALQDLVSGLRPGDQLSYAEIQAQSGVAMDLKGKGHLRTAAKRANRIYTSIRGFGVRMSSPQDGETIVRSDICRIDNAVKRSEKRGATILLQHGERMDVEARRRVTFMTSMFANIRVIAEAHKQQIKLEQARRPKLAAGP